MTICIFPGTFNPIHEAHLKMAEFALTNYGFDKVIFIPSYIPPHKELNRNLAKHRFNMVKLAGCMLGFGGVILINLGGDFSFEFTMLGEGFVILSGLSAAVNARARGRSVLVVSNPLEENPLWPAGGAVRMAVFCGRPCADGGRSGIRRTGAADGRGSVYYALISRLYIFGGLYSAGVHCKIQSRIRVCRVQERKPAVRRGIFGRDTRRKSTAFQLLHPDSHNFGVRRHIHNK